MNTARLWLYFKYFAIAVALALVGFYAFKTPLRNIDASPWQPLSVPEVSR